MDTKRYSMSLWLYALGSKVFVDDAANDGRAGFFTPVRLRK